MDEAVKWSEERRAWLVYDRDLILRALRCPALSNRRAQSRFSRLDGQARAQGVEIGRFLAMWPMFDDGDGHLCARAAGRATLDVLDDERFRRDFDEIAGVTVADAARHREIDAVVEIARPVSRGALRLFFDLPGALFDEIVVDGETLVRLIGTPEPAAEQVADAHRALRRLLATAQRIGARPASRGWTVVSEEAARHALSADQTTALAVNLVIDGHEPLESAIATGILRLVCGDPVDCDSVLSDAAPFQYCGRSATRELKLGDARVAAGDRVQLMIGVDRSAASSAVRRSVFGAGPHACPAAGLSRHIVQTALGHCATHLGGFRLADDQAARWRPSFGYRGLESLRLVVAA